MKTPKIKRKLKYNKKAFTLIELIVVISILAILGVISLISLEGYGTKAKLSARTTDINSLKKSLELYSMKVGKYPMPYVATNMEIDSDGDDVADDEAWHEGKFNENMFLRVRTINKVPLNPISGEEYDYSLSPNGREYQLGTYKTDEEKTMSFFNKTYAEDSIENGMLLDGNYNGVFVVSKNGVYYPSPTLFGAKAAPILKVGDTNQKVMTENGIVELNFIKLADEKPSNQEELVVFADNLRASYVSSPLAEVEESVYQDIVEVEVQNKHILAKNIVENLVYASSSSNLKNVSDKPSCPDGTVLDNNLCINVDGDLDDSNFGNNTSISINKYYNVTDANITSGSKNITLSGISGLKAGDEILIIQTQHASNAGNYEYAVIRSIVGDTLELYNPLNNSYYSGTFNALTSSVAQVVRVPRYNTFTLPLGKKIIDPLRYKQCSDSKKCWNGKEGGWNGMTGGIVAFKAIGDINIEGSIDMTGHGFRGGYYGVHGTSSHPGRGPKWGIPGESYTGKGTSTNHASSSRRAGSGGGGYYGRHGSSYHGYTSGGGGAYGTNGGNGRDGSSAKNTVGKGGLAYGSADLRNNIFFGGSGMGYFYQGSFSRTIRGGRGGGIIMIETDGNLNVTGNIYSKGQYSFKGNGAGGGIYIKADNAAIGTNLVNASGSRKSGKYIGGVGGHGRIHIDANNIDGTSFPTYYGD